MLTRVGVSEGQMVDGMGDIELWAEEQRECCQTSQGRQLHVSMHTVMVLF